MHKVEQVVKTFIEKVSTPENPILVAFSGGPDSLALLSALKKTSLPLKILHIDHRWRPESAEQAEYLSKHYQAEVRVLNPALLSGNLENASRMARLDIFKQACEEYGCQAVVLGHHANDQAETVLKRLFEGGKPLGIAPIQQMSGITLWRPLLNVTKQEIAEYLLTQELSGLEDSTNFDPKYLRPKMRMQIIPWLNQQFGKNVETSLCKLAAETQALETYLSRKLYLDAVSGPFGTYLDLEHVQDPFEIRYFIKNFVKLSAPLMEDVAQWIETGEANKKANPIVIVDRKKIFVLNEHSPKQWTLVEESEKQKPSSWREIWKGEGWVSLPKGNYKLGPSDNQLKDWWTNHKVPAFMKSLVPVIWEGDKIVHEFLTANYLRGLKTNSLCATMRIHYPS